GERLAGSRCSGRIQGRQRISGESERCLFRDRLHPLLIELGDFIGRGLLTGENADEAGIALNIYRGTSQVSIIGPENEDGRPVDRGGHMSRQRDSTTLKGDSRRERTALWHVGRPCQRGWGVRVRLPIA